MGSSGHLVAVAFIDRGDTVDVCGMGGAMGSRGNLLAVAVALTIGRDTGGEVVMFKKPEVDGQVQLGLKTKSGLPDGSRAGCEAVASGWSCDCEDFEEGSCVGPGC